MINSLDKIKNFINVEIGFEDDNDLLCQLSQQAEGLVEHDLNRCLTDCEPEAIKLQILFLIATWYANREITGMKTQEIPKTYDYLINQFRNYQL